MAAQIRYPFFKAVGRRFSVFGNTALATLIATGTCKLSQIWSMEDFWSSTLGKIIAVKLCLVAAMLLLSMLHNFVWGAQTVTTCRQVRYARV
ncbi:MAG: hypothetical protein A2901_00525 [Elusimicrobia bacterium RIFCSPLOWO2_01_FULL_54_10]|nr:MAG: hypothetical protein A2901_00525 [Elusimicrobia bacterium RIFCSPLOWO2_01_FULL_54_10]